MAPLHRHQIAWLTDAGWQRIVERDWDDGARACLAHWAAYRLPLVVTRQMRSDRSPADALALGLPAPGCFGRRRIALRVARSEVLYFDEFPQAQQLAARLPDAVRAGWQRLCAALQACGATARVYGSHGWQWLSGLDHVRSGSDIDLWIAVANAEQGDAAAAAMQAFEQPRLRLDGELVFDGDAAVAWREWQAWRAGRLKTLLVKTIDGASLRQAVIAPAAVDALVAA